ncbi:MAG: DUF305 domain-containing protein [Rhodospirillaceae bacterium]|nr:DUF305 domain-containing protein [Rhodospirillaceae bacterium]
MDHDMKHHHYKHLGISTAVNAVIMYLVMYTMIKGVEDFYNNINQVYMVLMMAAPMVIIMLFDMKSMYTDKKLNLILYSLSAALVVLGFVGMRSQALVGNEQFLKAMIPHHSAAILMCGKASITDPEIVKLCEGIKRSQQGEIDQMNEMLKRY